MNEAAWCYLEGFGGKKDKVSAFAVLAPCALEAYHGFQSFTGLRSPRCSIKNGHSNLYHRAACITHEPWIMQGGRQSRPCIGTSLSCHHNAFATLMHVNAILQKTKPGNIIDVKFGVSKSRYRSKAPKYNQNAINTAQALWLHHFGHQCMDEWQLPSSLRRACTLHKLSHTSRSPITIPDSPCMQVYLWTMLDAETY